jgi:hypothetical protein
MNKRFTGGLVAILLIIQFIISFGDDVPTNHANAADLSQFDAGNIISDSKFFDGNSFSSQQIQSWLETKVPTCTINNGQSSHNQGAPYYKADGSIYSYVASSCLKSYSQATPTMPVQPGFCTSYPGAVSESAAQIIAKVGQACGISPKILLILLEKEQSLVTDSWPLIKQFDEATGFECYDNGQPCVGGFAGFFYQVWAAARQFQRYGTGTFTWYPVGQVANIAYQANMPECGTKSVLIQNRATAALYYYTPYTPNNASLAAGYGKGDACSAYGNRNFYQLYVDWFGSARGFDTSGIIGEKYAQLSGSSGWLGYANGPQVCGLVGSGCYQSFSGGKIYSTPDSGTVAISNVFFLEWGQFGWERGFLGYPRVDPICGITNNGCYQAFTGGYIYSDSSAGVHAVRNDFFGSWGTQNWERGPLGFPTREIICGITANGCYQAFSGGYIYSSDATGAHSVRPEAFTLWGTHGWERGFLGFPTSDPSNTTNTYTQTFQGGTITVTNGVAVLTAASDPWIANVISSPWLGSATRNKVCGITANGCYQAFSGGYIYSSDATGAHSVRPEAFTLWGTHGWERGFLGFPTSDPSNTTNTYTQTFQGGTITVTNGIGRIQ